VDFGMGSGLGKKNFFKSATNLNTYHTNLNSYHQNGMTVNGANKYKQDN
jgi:hypothetical protein